MKKHVKQKTKRPLVLGAIVVGMFMSAIEATIVSTAMPSIVGDLGGFALFSWVFSAYLLMQAVTIPIYGKLADLYGRKPVFIFGISIFMISSLLCGFAPTMKMLIFFRLLQGFGAGAVMPIATTIVGDMYTMEERAKIQGYLASVWGISAIIGPLAGGFLVENVNWSWVFWVNIPLGFLCIAGIYLFLHESVDKKERSIDYLGSALLFISISALMIILIQGGVAWEWTSKPILLLMGVFLGGSVLFFIQERKAPEPTMPLYIWKHRLIVVANLASLTTGAVLIGVSSFLPAFVQGVMGKSPTIAGLTLTMMSIGWPISSMIAGRLLLRIGFRYTALIGGVALIIGSIFFLTLDASKGPMWAGFGTFFIGSGMGLTTTPFIVSIQNSVDWKTRGVATASNMFMRILGSTIGAAFLGGVLNSSMKQYLSTHAENVGRSVDLNYVNVLLEIGNYPSIYSEEMIHLLQTGLTVSLHNVYVGVFLLAVSSFILILFLPNRKK